MKLLSVNDKNEIIYETNDDLYITTSLLDILFSKYIQKVPKIRINYQYNYSDKQTIKVTFSNKSKLIYKDVPTKCGYIDVDVIKHSILEGGE